VQDRPQDVGDQYENEQVWQESRAELLRIHQNVVQILHLRAIHLFEILGRDDYLAILRSSVLNVIQRGDYDRALENFRDFILENPALDEMLPELTNHVEPGLTALGRWGQEYRVAELL
jgi:hypothetical protein